MVITDDYPTKISLFMEWQKKMPIKIRFINWHLLVEAAGFEPASCSVHL